MRTFVTLNNYYISLIYIFIILILPANLNSQIIPIEDQLPKDKKYWDYHKWYKNHSVIDIIANGEDPLHLEKILNQIKKFKSKGFVIRDIIIIGGNSFVALDPYTRKSLKSSTYLSKSKDPFKVIGISPKLIEYAFELNFGSPKSMPAIDSYIKDLSLTYSPVWLYTYNGVLNIYEGTFDPKLTSVDTKSNSNKKFGKIPIGSHFVSKNKTKLIPEKQKKETTHLKTFKFKMNDTEILPGTGKYDYMPDCLKSNTRRIKVPYYTKELAGYDFTYFNLENKLDKSKAEKLDRLVIPFLEGDIFNPWRKKPGVFQDFARFFDIQCLPTRVHFIYDSKTGNYYEEYREGELAWE